MLSIDRGYHSRPGSTHSKSETYKNPEGIPVLKTCRIVLRRWDIPLQLVFPEYDIATAGSVPDCAVTRAHTQFKRAMQLGPTYDMQVVDKQAAAEVAVISSFFKAVREDSIRICMAAWLGTLCMIDDILETLSPAAARKALEKSTSILKAIQDPMIESRLQKHSDVPILVSVFRTHCRKYIPKQVANQFFTAASNVCEGLSWELDYRQHHMTRPDIELYLQIRAQTIGIKPAFVLIRSLFSLGEESLTRCAELETVVSHIAGIQNDLLGLEKDFEAGEGMNAVVVLLHQEKKSTQDRYAVSDAATRIAGLHNQYAKIMLQMLQSQREAMETGSSEEALTMTIISAFAESHMKWCLSAKRYQLNVTQVEFL